MGFSKLLPIVSSENFKNKTDEKEIKGLINFDKSSRCLLNYGFVEFCKNICTKVFDFKHLQTRNGLLKSGNIIFFTLRISFTFY